MVRLPAHGPCSLLALHRLESLPRGGAKPRIDATTGQVALYRVSVYDTFAQAKEMPMIRSFADKDTEKIAHGKRVRAWVNIERQIQRKLQYLKAAAELRDLGSPPGNMLEALKGDRLGQYSIRINDQYRICFRWQGNDAYDVEVVDYH